MMAVFTVMGHLDLMRCDGSLCLPLAEHCDPAALNCLLFPQKASKYAVSVPSLTLFNGLGSFSI